MSITQTVEIPANHRLHLDFEVPIEIPVGKAQIELKVIPFVNKPDNSGKLRLSKQELDEMLRNAQTPISDSLTGILAHLGDITVVRNSLLRLLPILKNKLSIIIFENSALYIIEPYKFFICSRYIALSIFNTSSIIAL
jgi:hypothetical protein